MKKCNKCVKCKQHPKTKNVQKEREREKEWSPLLLVIPLRLGLNEFNLDYKEAIKVKIKNLLKRESCIKYLYINLNNF